MTSDRLARPAATVADASLATVLSAWRQRMAAAGVNCVDVALAAGDPRWSTDFDDALRSASWGAVRGRLSPDDPVALDKCGDELLMATRLALPDRSTGVVGLALLPPHNERTMQLVLLSLGWLQIGLANLQQAEEGRAARLLEIVAFASSQRRGLAAAQEWIDRTAAWLRNADPLLADLALTLFRVRRGVPHFWVAADTSWAEAAAPSVQAAAEVAARAAVQMRETRDGPWLALPCLDDGEPTAVLVARSEATAWAPESLVVLRAGLALTEPLLRHWRQADRSLWSHGLEAGLASWRKLSGPGHPSWKAGAVAAAALVAVLLLWPVADRVTANLVIEGRTRQVMTAPFDGFVAEALVRPGARVARGQALAKLDTRDLRLERDKHRSEREQASGKLRQAMAERDASAMALAAAELHQAEAQLALVESKLERAVLTAPVDGLVVTGDWVQQIGGPVETGKEMFEIAAGEGYRVVLHVPDQDIARVRVGQGGALRLTGQPGTTYAFRVSNVTATASVQDGGNGFRVEAAWDGAAPPLSPGMQGVGKVTVGESNLLTIWTRSSMDWLRLKLWSWW